MRVLLLYYHRCETGSPEFSRSFLFSLLFQLCCVVLFGFRCSLLRSSGNGLRWFDVEFLTRLFTGSTVRVDYVGEGCALCFVLYAAMTAMLCSVVWKELFSSSSQKRPTTPWFYLEVKFFFLFRHHLPSTLLFDAFERFLFFRF